MDDINRVHSGGILAKQDKAICLLLLKTELKAIVVGNIRLSDIGWNKDIIYMEQQKIGTLLHISFRNFYENAIADYILNGRRNVSQETFLSEN